MVTETIGVRELQQHASRVVRDVEQGRAEYRITVQGRDTGVVVTSAPTPRFGYGVTAAEAIAKGMWSRPIPEHIKQKMLSDIEAGREAEGYIGDGWAANDQSAA